MKTYIAATPIKFNGKDHRPQSRIQLPDEVARELLISGAVLVIGTDPGEDITPSTGTESGSDTGDGAGDGGSTASTGGTGQEGGGESGAAAETKPIVNEPAAPKKTATPKKTAAKRAARS